jgi:hypothetical protein
MKIQENFQGTSKLISIMAQLRNEKTPTQLQNRG